MLDKPLPLLVSLVGAEGYQAMRRDPCLFVKAFDGRTPFDWQAQALRQTLEVDPATGRLLKPVSILSVPRQCGKSSVSAWLGLIRLFLDPTTDADVITVALDRSGAQVILSDARKVILSSDLLMSIILPSWGLQRESIKTRDGRTWHIRSSDAQLSRGYRVGTFLYDESAHAQDEGRLFDTVSAAMGAVSNPLTVLTSTVGYTMAGKLWDLMKAAERGDPSIRVIYHTDSHICPLISDEYLAREEQILTPSRMRVEHFNEWGQSSDAFCSMREWNAATNSPDPRTDRCDPPTYAAVDLGWIKDESVVAICKPTGDGQTSIVAMEAWRGSRDKPLVLATVRSRIEKMVEDYGVAHLTIESPQGLSMGQEINVPRSCKVEVLSPTSKSNMERLGLLYQALHEGTIRLPHDELLRRQLLGLVIQSTATGWKTTDDSAVHQDRVVAIAAAHFDAAGGAPSRWRHIPFLALAGDQVVKVVGGELKVLFDADQVAFQNLSEPRKVRIRQLAMSGVSSSTLRVQFSVSRAVLSKVLDEVGFRLSDPEEAR